MLSERCETCVKFSAKTQKLRHKSLNLGSEDTVKIEGVELGEKDFYNDINWPPSAVIT